MAAQASHDLTTGVRVKDAKHVTISIHVYIYIYHVVKRCKKKKTYIIDHNGSV